MASAEDPDRDTAEPGQPVDLVPDRDGLDRYLEDTIVVDWQSPAVLEKARTLTEGQDAEAERVRALHAFVRDEISDSLAIETEALPCSASAVLRAGTGLSYARSHLLVALLRSRGTPAGFAYQLLCLPPLEGRPRLVGSAAAWVAARDRFVVVDPAAGMPGEFGRVPDPDLGEQTYPMVFARPLKTVVDLIDYADNLGQVRNHLPDSLGR